MQNMYIRVKGILKKEDKYLIVKRWVDDHIPEPYVWEFVEVTVLFGESPTEALQRGVKELLSAESSIERILYTWSQMMGDTQCVGITFLCHMEEADDVIELPEEYVEYKWVTKEEFPNYIENVYMLRDIAEADL